MGWGPSPHTEWFSQSGRQHGLLEEQGNPVPGLPRCATPLFKHIGAQATASSSSLVLAVAGGLARPPGGVDATVVAADDQIELAGLTGDGADGCTCGEEPADRTPVIVDT